MAFDTPAMTSTQTPDPTVTSIIPSPTETQSGSSATSSPLLFFVALGFGVLFTNLWIIVGVKYCFRYSQRNRRGQLEEEVDLATLHPFVGLTHPVQRRRREKKLLKIDDVNERFPVMTYKAWRAQRERQGLSAEGGIANATDTLPTVDSPAESPPATPPSRTRSPVNETPEVSETNAPPPQDTLQPYIDVTATPAPPTEPHSDSEKQPITISDVEEVQDPIPVPSTSKHRDSTLSVDPDDEDENPNIPNDLLATSGDNCAICIELLEDEDEVRGLTCGHCYHQSCIDPWLTQRRASCPLCKADYYIPRPPQEANSDGNANSTTAEDGSTRPPVTTEHWAPVFFRPFRPAVMPSYPHAYGGLPRRYRLAPEPSSDPAPRSPRPSRWRIHRIPRDPPATEMTTPTTATTTTNTITSTTSPQSSSSSPASRWNIPSQVRQLNFHNPFRRNTTTNNEQSALERGDGQTRPDRQ